MDYGLALRIYLGACIAYYEPVVAHAHRIDRELNLQRRELVADKRLAAP